jgi:hypothetical protein
MCDYKKLLSYSTSEKIQRQLYRSTGLPPPDIDVVVFKYDKIFTGKDGPTQIQDGRVRPLNIDSPFVGILIKVLDYASSGKHSAHAISAVKSGKTLFAFNAWGKRGRVIDDRIFKQIKTLYKCDKIVRYRGEDLQATDPHGVCAGYASNFVTLIMKELMVYPSSKKYLQTKKFSQMIYSTLSTKGLCFGKQCKKIKNLHDFMEGNLQTSVRSPDVQPSDYAMSLTLRELRTYAGDRCLVGRSKYPRKADLQKFVKGQSDLKPKGPPIKVTADPLGGRALRKYSAETCVKGRSKYTTRRGLFKYMFGN